MICLAGVGPHAARIEEGDDLLARAALHPQRDDALAPGIVRAADDVEAGNVRKAPQIAGAAHHRLGERLLVIVDGAACGLEAGAAVLVIRVMTAEPGEIVDDIREGGVAAGVARAHFPVGGGAADHCFLGAGGEPVRGPADAVAVARERLVGRDGIAVDAAGGEVHRAMAGVLDAVHHDEATGRDLADGGGDGGYVHRHAGDGRGVDDGGKPHIGGDVAEIGGNIHVARRIVMRDQHMRAARHLRPARHGAARGRVLQRGGEQDAA